jgi:hypothetical protein
MSKNICTVETEHRSQKYTLTSSPDEDFIVYRVNTSFFPKHGSEPIVYHGPPCGSNRAPQLTAQWTIPTGK